MTTITRERLTKILIETMSLIKERSSRTGDASGISTEVNASLFAEVTRMALASLTAEPVAYADPQSFDNFKSMGGKNAACTKEWMWRDSGDGLIPVYAAPPAPVVPDEAYSDDCPDLYPSQPDAWSAGWNAWRAAMLRGADGNSPVIPECSCRTCHPVTMTDMRFVVCPECGNKRCPHANDHRHACTGSNEPGQVGSAYPASPQQEVK